MPQKFFTNPNIQFKRIYTFKKNTLTLVHAAPNDTSTDTSTYTSTGNTFTFVDGVATFTGTGSLTNGSSILTANCGTQIVGVIVNGYNNIGYESFAGSYLSSITTDINVTTISEYAFIFCYNLVYVNFTNVQTIGEYCFGGCNLLANVYLPSSLTSIGYYGFATYVSTPGSVVTMNVYLPQQNSLNPQVTLGSSASPYVIPPNYFYGRTTATNMIGTNVINGVITFTGTGIFTNGTSQLFTATSVILVGYTAIGTSAFENATTLMTITLNPELTTIGTNAFLNTELTTVYINEVNSLNLTPSNTVTSFYGAQITNIILSIDISNDVITFAGPGTFTNGTFTNGTEQLSSPTSIILVGYSAIAANALQNATTLKTITINPELTTIGTNAFLNTGLTTVYITSDNLLNLTPSNTVTSFYGTQVNNIILSTYISNNVITFTGAGTFTNGTSQLLTATSVILVGYSAIAASAFQNATNLLTITINPELTTIGNNAFLNTGLTSVYMYGANQLLPQIPYPTTSPVTFFGANNVNIFSAYYKYFGFYASDASGIASGNGLVPLTNSTGTWSQNDYSISNSKVELFTSGYCIIKASTSVYIYNPYKFNVNVILVGGGGGGGGSSDNGSGGGQAGGGGGQGGGTTWFTLEAVPTGNYNITIGKGGSGGSHNDSGTDKVSDSNGTAGGNSYFYDSETAIITALGGGPGHADGDIGTITGAGGEGGYGGGHGQDGSVGKTVNGSAGGAGVNSSFYYNYYGKLSILSGAGGGGGCYTDSGDDGKGGAGGTVSSVNSSGTAINVTVGGEGGSSTGGGGGNSNNYYSGGNGHTTTVSGDIILEAYSQISTNASGTGIIAGGGGGGGQFYANWSFGGLNTVSNGGDGSDGLCVLFFDSGQMALNSSNTEPINNSITSFTSNGDELTPSLIDTWVDIVYPSSATIVDISVPYNGYNAQQSYLSLYNVADYELNMVLNGNSLTTMVEPIPVDGGMLTFTTPGSYVINITNPNNVAFTMLAVGGGGGGGGGSYCFTWPGTGGGGGGGGEVQCVTHILESGVYIVTVGAGGDGGSNSPTPTSGKNGIQSMLQNFVLQPLFIAMGGEGGIYGGNTQQSVYGTTTSGGAGGAGGSGGGGAGGGGGGGGGSYTANSAEGVVGVNGEQASWNSISYLFDGETYTINCSGGGGGGGAGKDGGGAGKDGGGDGGTSAPSRDSTNYNGSHGTNGGNFSTTYYCGGGGGGGGGGTYIDPGTITVTYGGNGGDGANGIFVLSWGLVDANSNPVTVTINGDSSIGTSDTIATLSTPDPAVTSSEFYVATYDLVKKDNTLTNDSSGSSVLSSIGLNQVFINNPVGDKTINAITVGGGGGGGGGVYSINELPDGPTLTYIGGNGGGGGYMKNTNLGYISGVFDINVGDGGGGGIYTNVTLVAGLEISSTNGEPSPGENGSPTNISSAGTTIVSSKGGNGGPETKDYVEAYELTGGDGNGNGGGGGQSAEYWTLLEFEPEPINVTENSTSGTNGITTTITNLPTIYSGGGGGGGGASGVGATVSASYGGSPGGGNGGDSPQDGLFTITDTSITAGGGGGGSSYLTSTTTQYGGNGAQGVAVIYW